jgi:hypothetical protein
MTSNDLKTISGESNALAAEDLPSVRRTGISGSAEDEVCC